MNGWCPHRSGIPLRCKTLREQRHQQPGIAYVSASLAGVSAAVQDGLGLTLLPRRLATCGHRLLSAADGFERVPDLELAVHARADLTSAAKALAALVLQVGGRVMEGEGAANAMGETPCETQGDAG